MTLVVATPSCFDAIGASPATPMIGRTKRLSLRVRSSVILYVSPRSSEMKSRLPPIRTMRGLCGESTVGVFQKNRNAVPSGGSGTTLDAEAAANCGFWAASA